MVTKQIRILGRVQGVWYRGWTVDQATALGVSGWVRNRRDGSVEAVFSGPDTVVDEMIALCRTGPPAARVTEVTEKTVTYSVNEGFRQLKTE